MKAYNIELKTSQGWEIISGPYFEGLLSGRDAQKELAEFVNCWPRREFRIVEAKRIDEPDVQMAMVYDGGSIQYFGGHHLPQLTVTLYKTTTLGELWEEILAELWCVADMFHEYPNDVLNKALAYFYFENIYRQKSKVFARFSREETRAMDESGEGSAYIFVFGRPESGGPMRSTYVVYP